MPQPQLKPPQSTAGTGRQGPPRINSPAFSGQPKKHENL